MRTSVMRAYLVLLSLTPLCFTACGDASISATNDLSTDPGAPWAPPKFDAGASGTSTATLALVMDINTKGPALREQGILSNVAPNDDDVVLELAGASWFGGRGKVGHYALYRSDGTAAGTSALISLDEWTHSPVPLTTFGGKLYFRGTDAAHGSELWVTDGTTSGTSMLFDADPGTGPSTPRYVGQNVTHFYFTASTGVLGSSEADARYAYLYRSDGTTTTRVSDVPVMNALAHQNGRLSLVVGDRIYFTSAEPSIAPYEPWVSDGTPAGTHLLRQISTTPPSNLAQGSSPSGWSVAGTTVLFFATDTAHGRELWRTDGTTDGTVLVKDINPGTTGNNVNLNLAAGPTAAGNNVYFCADDGVHGQELWRSDGTTAGTALVKDFYPGSTSGATQTTNIVALGTRVLFTCSIPGAVASSSLCVSDGTDAGTTLVTHPYVGPSPAPVGGDYTLRWLKALGGAVYFFTNDGVSGLGLWRSDGTAAGTSLVRAFDSPAAKSAPINIASGRVWYAARDADQMIGMWSSEGTASGTRALGRLAEGTAGSAPANFAAVGDKLFFTADDGDHGQTLWVTDGHTTTRLTDVLVTGQAILGSHGGFLYFGATDAAHGQELWRSDGTFAGTQLFLDLNPGAGSGFGYGAMSIVEDGRALFLGNDGTHGQELWVTDSTVAGTHMVSDMNAGAAAGPDFNTAIPTLWNGELYFDGSDATGTGLFRSDGTTLVRVSAAGSQFYTLEAGPDALWMAQAAPRSLVRTTGTPATTTMISPISLLLAIGTLGNKLALGTRHELFASDGTAAGLAKIADIAPFSNGAIRSRPFAKLGSKLYFQGADYRHGSGLWETDLTRAGTTLVKAFARGIALDQFLFGQTALVPIGDRVYFGANDGLTGSELWESDGTTAGTRLVADAAPGPASSSPVDLIAVGKVLYMRLDDGSHGAELWRMEQP